MIYGYRYSAADFNLENRAAILFVFTAWPGFDAGCTVAKPPADGKSGVGLNSGGTFQAGGDGRG